MADKESFKKFVVKHPELVSVVNSGEMTWQKFYEMYDLYGEENSAWDNYFKKNTEAAAATAATSFGINDLVSWLKGINLDTLQSGVNSLQRVVGLISDLGDKNDKPHEEEYKPRPIYKHFED